MSAAEWAFWAILTVGNVALLVASSRLLSQSRGDLARALQHLDESGEILDDAQRVLAASRRERGQR